MPASWREAPSTLMTSPSGAKSSTVSRTSASGPAVATTSASGRPDRRGANLRFDADGFLNYYTDLDRSAASTEVAGTCPVLSCVPVRTRGADEGMCL